MSGSYAVLFVSLAAHAAQFAFLVFFENPRAPWSFLFILFLCSHRAFSFSFSFLIDIERMYGKRKAIAKRTPLFSSDSTNTANGPVESSAIPSTVNNLPLRPDFYTSTPAITEGDTATDTELETETEIEEIIPHISNMKLAKMPRHQPNLSIESTMTNGHVDETSIGSKIPSVWPRNTKVGTPQKRKVVSQHDLLNKYFRRDTVVLRNIDLLRWECCFPTDFLNTIR